MYVRKRNLEIFLISFGVECCIYNPHCGVDLSNGNVSPQQMEIIIGKNLHPHFSNVDTDNYCKMLIFQELEKYSSFLLKERYRFMRPIFNSKCTIHTSLVCKSFDHVILNGQLK